MEPTPWELKRSVDDLKQMLRDGFTAWNLRADRAVTTELFNTHVINEQQGFTRVESDIKAIRDDIHALAKQRESFQRQIILVGVAAVLSLVGSVLVNIIGRL